MRIRGLLIVGLLALSGAPCAAAEWAHWRGPARNGITPEASGWNGNEWPIREIWRAQAGEGSTSPLIVGGRVYILGWKNAHDTLRCLRADTGQEVWKAAYTCPRYGRVATGDQFLYAGTSSTPEFDPETQALFTLSCDGDLNCWDARTGTNVWKLNLYDRYKTPQRPKVGRSGRRDYGYTSSPLVHGPWVIVEAGATAGNLIAFDKRTGTQAWASESRSPAGHNGGPVPIVVDAVPCVAVHTLDGLLVARLDGEHAGKTVATHPWATDYANNIVTLAVHGRSVLLTSGYNQNRIARFDISLAQGAKQVWETPEASQVCSPVIHEGSVYWAWRRMHCLDFETGRVRWQGGQFGDDVSIVATGDNRLIVWADRGKLLLVEMAGRAPDRYLQLAARTVLNHTEAWPHVAVAGGRLYCKDRAGTLVCYALDGGG